MSKITLATIGSTTFMADAQDGRLDLYAMVDGPLSGNQQMRQIGLSVMFEDLDNFAAAVREALKIARPKPGRRSKRKAR